MKKITIISFITAVFLNVATIHAQEFVQEHKFTSENSGLYAGGQASTNGFGLQAGYILNKKFTFRTGFETLNLKYNFDFDENDISYNADLNFKTGGIFILADYYYTSRLYISLGGILNSFNPKIDGKAVSDMKYGDISIPAEDVGEFSFNIDPKLKMAPYVIAGFRQFIGKKERVVYNFETGFYYMNGPKLKIEATGLLSPTADPAHGQVKYLENQFSNYKVYPILKFNLAYKLL